MKAKISALMDGELHDFETAAPLRALRQDPEALETWRRYHLIGDALRDTTALSSGFSSRFAARLADEPTQLSPASVPKHVEHRRFWVPLSAAASLAGVLLVGWLAFTPQPEQFARAPVQVQAAALPAESASVAIVAMPREADDYLRAHQNYSPRNSLQGVAPYVRTVSDPVRQR